MKKITLTLIFICTLFSLTSCKYYVPRYKEVTYEEVQEFLEDKESPFADGKNASFEYDEFYETYRVPYIFSITDEYIESLKKQ